MIIPRLLRVHETIFSGKCYWLKLCFSNKGYADLPRSFTTGELI